MNVLKHISLLAVGALIGVILSKNLSTKVEVERIPVQEFELSTVESWAETDLATVIGSANNGAILPSVMLVSAFGDYLLVPNRFQLSSLYENGVRFNTSGIKDPKSTGMTDNQSHSITMFDLSDNNVNSVESRATRDSVAADAIQCYGIDIVLHRTHSQSRDLTIITATMFRDDLMVMISQTGEIDLWKQMLARFVNQSDDEGTCLDSIDYIDQEIP